MKFLSKRADSKILQNCMRYSNNPSKNKELKEALLEEQKGFCAYTEKYIDHLESVDIEHFNSSLKNTNEDGYYNYYAVLHKVNINKLDEKYSDAKFHETLFFQNKDVLDSRIFISDDMLYMVTDSEDIEAKDFVDFLMLNSNSLYEARKKHISFLSDMLKQLGDQKFLDLFKRHKSTMSYISVIENKFNLNLDHLL